MKVRFGRDIYCQKCGKDDQITHYYSDQFAYHYRCNRCHVKVIEKDRSIEKVPVEDREMYLEEAKKDDVRVTKGI